MLKNENSCEESVELDGAVNMKQNQSQDCNTDNDDSIRKPFVASI